MQTYSQTIAAGGRVKLQTPGTFFRLLSTAAPVSVAFFRRGAEVGRAEDMEAGYAERFEEAFDEVEISTATEQAPKWAIRLGGTMQYDRMAGEVSVIGGTLTVGVSGGIVGISNELKTHRPYSNAWKSTAGLAAGANEVILSPAANVGGAVLRRFSGNTYSTVAHALAVVLVKGSAPANATDGDLLTHARQVGGVNFSMLFDPVHDIYIPAGLGVYLHAVNALSAGDHGARYALVDILPT